MSKRQFFFFLKRSFRNLLNIFFQSKALEKEAQSASPSTPNHLFPLKCLPSPCPPFDPQPALDHVSYPKFSSPTQIYPNPQIPKPQTKTGRKPLPIEKLKKKTIDNRKYAYYGAVKKIAESVGVVGIPGVSIPTKKEDAKANALKQIGKNLIGAIGTQSDKSAKAFLLSVSVKGVSYRQFKMIHSLSKRGFKRATLRPPVFKPPKKNQQKTGAPLIQLIEDHWESVCVPIPWKTTTILQKEGRKVKSKVFSLFSLSLLFLLSPFSPFFFFFLLFSSFFSPFSFSNFYLSLPFF